MQRLFEEWRGFLNEKLMLKPGPTGWELYAELVTQAYERAPSFDNSAVASFEALEPFINKMFKQIQAKVKVEPTDVDPYKSDAHMKAEVLKTGVLKVFTGGTDHQIFSPELNIKLRVVHDWMAHIQPNTTFTQKGEIQAYNAHLKTIPPAGAPALFTEVVGQAMYFTTRGNFPEQKIAILEGFDFFNIGVVDPEITGYRLDPEKKELVKV